MSPSAQSISSEGSSTGHERRLSSKAKSVMKGLSGALHHGKDKSPSMGRRSIASSEPSLSPKVSVL